MIYAVASMVVAVWQMGLCVAIVADMIRLLGHDSELLTALVGAGGRVHQEMWLIMPAPILVAATHHWADGSWYWVFFDALSLYNWWTLRNFPDDENRWKRRGKKLRDAVKVRAGRLVVVPT